jgi:two-component system phosphate regulon sensor histidine kinase PhoR
MTVSNPGPVRWTGPLLVGAAVASIVGGIDLLEIRAAEDARRSRQTLVAQAAAAEFDGLESITPAAIARLQALSGATLVARGDGRSVRADGDTPSRKPHAGVPIPTAPSWRLEASLPANVGDPTLSTLLDALLAGGVAGGVTALVRRRVRGDVRRLQHDLEGLLRLEPTAAAEARRRVSMPDTALITSIARPLNDLLAQIGRRLTTIESARGRQNLVIESMAAGVLVLDADGAVDTINPAARRLFDVALVSPRGRPLAEVVRESDLHEMVARAIETGKPQRQVFRSAQSSPDRQRELATAVAPIVDRRAASGPPSIGGVVVLVEDATYLRRLERARTEFVGNVSHELRTPITNLLGYIETAMELGPDDHEMRTRFLGVVQRNAQRLATIIEDLLSLASLEASGRRLDRDRVRLRPLLDRIAERHRASLGDDPRSIEVTCEGGHEVLGVATLLDQAIDNLVSNALRYGSPTGRVRIEAARSPEGDTEIAVADDGPGIPPRHLPRLFERFYRVDTARSRQEGGTGLGLAIVKHIAGAHGGTVEVESVLGIGTRFLIRIPDRDDAADVDPLDPTPETTGHPPSIPEPSGLKHSRTGSEQSTRP